MKTNFFENRLSDHRHMTYTILKTKFKKFEPKKLIHRNFKQLTNLYWIFVIVCLL